MAKKIVRNSNGFLLVSLLTLLPLLITITLGLGVGGQLLQQKSTSDRLCRSATMRMQKDLAKFLTSLMILNVPAATLLAQEAKAHSMIASVYPPTVAAGTTLLSQVKVRQLKLNRKQNALLRMADLRILAWKAEMNLKLRPQIKGAMRLQDPQESKLAVEPVMKGLTAPPYRTIAQFEEKQKAGAAWSTSLHWIVPQIFHGFLKHSWFLPSRCYASITFRSSKWVPVLREGKSLSR